MLLGSASFSLLRFPMTSLTFLSKSSLGLIGRNIVKDNPLERSNLFDSLQQCLIFEEIQSFDSKNAITILILYDCASEVSVDMLLGTLWLTSFFSSFIMYSFSFILFDSSSQCNFIHRFHNSWCRFKSIHIRNIKSSIPLKFFF